jgi:hypothetical protein
MDLLPGYMSRFFSLFCFFGFSDFWIERNQPHEPNQRDKQNKPEQANNGLE